MQPDDVLRIRQRLSRRIPDEAIDAISERRRSARLKGGIRIADFCDDSRISARAAFGPVQVNTRVRGEIRVKRDSEESALRGGINGKIKDNGGNCAVHDSLHPARSFFDHEEIVRTEEGNSGGLAQTVDDGCDLKVGISKCGVDSYRELRNGQQ